MTTTRHALHNAVAALEKVSPTARLDAEILLAHVLNLSRAMLLVEDQRALTIEQLTEYQALIARRQALEPVAYIIGHKEFYGLDFLVDQRVLVPRPETELVVELALACYKHTVVSSPTIADIGTGSGCIAVTLAAQVPSVHAYAIDVSQDALAVAQLNVERHGVMERVTLLHGAGCAPLPQPVGLIVANPPYTVLAQVDENVYRWEPHLALDGGPNHGFAIPAHLLAETRTYLEPGGVVVMEIGAWQGKQAVELAADLFPAARVTLHQDLAGLDRVLLVETAAPKG